MIFRLKEVDDREKARNAMLVMLKTEGGELGDDKEMLTMVEQRHFLEREKDRTQLLQYQNTFKKALMELSKA